MGMAVTRHGLPLCSPWATGTHDRSAQTLEFSSWLRRLKDNNAATRIVGRIRRMEQGNPGDVRSVGAGVMEMRIDYGPGYRAYFVQHGSAIVILLCAGDKRTQATDIKQAHVLAREIAERR